MNEQTKIFDKREEFFQAIVAAEVLGLWWRGEARKIEEGMGAGENEYVLIFGPWKKVPNPS